MAEEQGVQIGNGGFKNTGAIRGRPKGSIGRDKIEVREMCRRLLEDVEYFKNLQLRMRCGEAPPAVETMVWHYAYGKPKDVIEFRDVTNEFSDLNSEQLRLEAMKLASVLVTATPHHDENGESGDDVATH